MKNTARVVWRVARWPLLAMAVLYICLVIYRIPAVGEKQRTAETVVAIEAQRLALADVLGSTLPPMPDEQENNATLAGVDANQNGIRDDVERAIFAKYPNQARMRAAQLQYAMELQNEFTRVTNSETLVAAIRLQSRGSFCIGLNQKLVDQVEDFVFNTEKRKKARNALYEKYQPSFTLPNDSGCDIDQKLLPN